MKYALLIYDNEAEWAERPVADNAAILDAYGAFGEYAGERILAGDGLQPTATATTVRVRDGERLLSDGPFADTKEHLIGFYVIEVPDLDTALAWAARVPNVRAGSVEVRPVLPTAEAARTDATAAASVG
ncbi:MAG: YciI family protein [Blastococcus sp.]